MLHLGTTEYLRKTIALRHVWIGLAKTLRLRVGGGPHALLLRHPLRRSAAAVGEATTRAVVMGIVLVVVVAIATVLLASCGTTERAVAQQVAVQEDAAHRERS